jgi:LacI family transcriptional regulator
MATIHDVAVRAGVSATTVSHVINQTRPVSDELSARVQDAMRELGYQPNTLERSLRRKQTHTVGLLVPDSANPYFAEIASAVEDASFDVGYMVIVCNSAGDPAREMLYLDLLLNKQVDGVLLMPAGDASAIRPRLTPELPLVLLDRELPGLAVDCVLTDNVLGGHLATEHLIERGHHRVACVTGPPGVASAAARVEGYTRALATVGMAVDDELLVEGDFSDSSGYAAARRLLVIDDPPTALFACNDLMAIGAIGFAARFGVRIPAELAVIGFDDIHLAAYTNPSLTTVSQPTTELGRVAVQLLLERMQDRSLDPRRRLLAPRLVVRSSTG